MRVVVFCDLEKKSEFRLVTNLFERENEEISNEEIGDFCGATSVRFPHLGNAHQENRLRWQIELFWKFLKMHLKLDRLITKNTNGIEIQIYSCLVAYVLLKLVKIPQELGEKTLDKLRYLQAFMCENISYIHWFKKLVAT